MDHRFFNTSTCLVTALNYKEAGRLKCPNKQLAQLPTSLGKQQQTEKKVLNGTPLSHTQNCLTCVNISLWPCFQERVKQCTESDEHHKMLLMFQVLT